MRLCYDLHIHSCLSPCASNDMTPQNVAYIVSGMNLDLIAIADHNSIKNYRAFESACFDYGVCVLPAMELETSENIHVLMLFPNYKAASAFYAEIETKSSGLKNREEIFGEQLVMDRDDKFLGKEENMLVTATQVGVYDCAGLADKFGGVAIPAHVDRTSNGLIAILGDINPDMGFATVEVSSCCDSTIIDSLVSRGYRVISDSDAHYLEQIGSSRHKNYLDVDNPLPMSIIKLLKTKKEIKHD